MFETKNSITCCKYLQVKLHCALQLYGEREVSLWVFPRLCVFRIRERIYDIHTFDLRNKDLIHERSA